MMLDSETLKARLRYQGKQYSSGAKGGSTEPHMLEQAADRIDALESALNVIWNAVKLEREACAKICDDRASACETRLEKTDDEDDRTELKANAWQFSVLAAEIRKRHNT